MNTHNLSTIANILNARWDNPLMPPVIYMTDEHRAPNPFPTINNLSSRSGVIFRHYNIKSRFGLGLDIKKECKKRNLLFIVAGDYSLAHKLNADGLHLPEYMLLNPGIKTMLWRKMPKKLLTASAHSKNALMKCSALCIDAALVSPVFPTKSHLMQHPLGISKFQTMVKASSIPVYALGGINNNNAARLINSPAIGLAGISGISQV